MKDWIIRRQLQTSVTNEKTPLVRDGDSYALGGATPHSDIKNAIVRCANGAILTQRCYSLDEPTGLLTFRRIGKRRRRFTVSYMYVDSVFPWLYRVSLRDPKLARMQASVRLYKPRGTVMFADRRTGESKVLSGVRITEVRGHRFPPR